VVAAAMKNGRQNHRKPGKRPLESAHNHGAEQSLLGCCFRDASLVSAIIHDLIPDHFHSHRFKKVFEAIQTIHRNGGRIDVVTVGEELNSMGCLVEIDGVRTLAEVATLPTAAAWKQYKRIVEAKYCQREIGLVASDLRAESDAKSGPTSETLDAVIARLTILKNRSEGANRDDSFDVMDGQILDSADLKIEYVIEGVLARGQQCCIGGPEKSCKTLIACEMAISLVTATPFLGRFRVTRSQNTLLMSSESGVAVLQDNLRVLCRNRGSRLSDLKNFFLFPDTPDISQKVQLRKLRQTCKAKQIEVFIIDPMYLSMGSDLDAGNLFNVGSVLKGLSDLAQELGITLVVCHHTNKTLGLGKPCKLSNLAWAGWREWVRQWILINRKSEFDPNDGRHDLVLSIGGSAGHTGEYLVAIDEGDRSDPERKIQIEVKSISEQSHHPSNREQQAEVLAILADHPQGMTQGAIRSITKVNGGRLSAIVKSLLSDGLVETVELKVKGRLRTGIRLPNEHRSTPVRTGHD